MSPRSPANRNQLLEEQVCFALYAASRAVTDTYRPLLGEFGLTYPQYLVLLTLWERDPRTVKEIADALHLDYGTVSPLLKRLEARGLVRRERLASDERTVAVTLTDEGRAMQSAAAHIPAAISCATGLDHDARRSLIRALRELTASTLTDSHAPEERPRHTT